MNNIRENDVFVSTRVRLARNLKDYPFEPRLSETGRKEIIEKVRGAFENTNGYSFSDFSSLSPAEKMAMAEKHTVSPEFAEKKSSSALVENDEKGVYIMVCEEDHLRIQAILPGFDLDTAAERALEADDLLDNCLNYAYDGELGYLTHCPTNLGTGMRASVMMFLPAMTASGELKYLTHQLSKLGITVRGMTGEGSTSKGCLYQFSNCVTEGISEEEIKDNLRRTVEQIAEKERELRKAIAENDPDGLRDRIMRAVGTLSFAYRMDTEELLELYSLLRLGICCGIVGGMTPEDADSLLFSCRPATLTLSCGKPLSSKERDKYRAAKLKEVLNEHKIYGKSAECIE